MCGRFAFHSNADAMIEAFGIDELFCDVAPNYNAAPTQQVYVVLHENEQRLLTSMRWGLIPGWAKDISFGNKTINARAETAAEKPSFRSAFRHRRCLVVANGYYEWQREGKKKRPMYIHRAEGDEALLAFAGLWESWSDPDGEELETCTILTTEANDDLREIHDRMPVVLDRPEQTSWLDHRRFDLSALHRLMRPYHNGALQAYQVSNKVNHVKSNGPDCIEPAPPEVEEPPAQGTLFDLF